MEEKKIEETVNQLTKIKKDRKKQKQKMPKEVSQIIFKKIFNQLLAAICIMLYFVILNLAYVNMREERLIGDIKVFAGAFLVVGIVMLEKAYRKEIGKYVVIGIELLVLSLHTLSIMHIITLLEYDFRLYLLTSSYIFSIYYVLKSIVIYVRERRIYLRGLSDISEIVKKEEPTKKEATKKVAKEESENKTEEEKMIAVSKDKTVKKEGKKTSTKKSQAKGKATTKKGEKETDMKKKNVSSEKGKIETKKIVSSKGEGKIETKKTESAKKEEKVATKKKVSSKEQRPTKGNAKTKKEEEKKTTRNTTSSQKANKKGTSKKTKTQKQKEEEVNGND